MRVHGGGAPRCHTTAGFGNALPDARCRVRVRLRAGPGAPHSPCCPERRARPHPLRAPPAPSNRTAPVARRDRIVVSTLRCGRSNLGSNPSHGIASARRYHGIRARVFFFAVDPALATCSCQPFSCYSLSQRALLSHPLRLSEVAVRGMKEKRGKKKKGKRAGKEKKKGKERKNKRRKKEETKKKEGK